MVLFIRMFIDELLVVFFGIVLFRVEVVSMDFLFLCVF